MLALGNAFKWLKGTSNTEGFCISTGTTQSWTTALHHKDWEHKEPAPSCPPKKPHKAAGISNQHHPDRSGQFQNTPERNAQHCPGRKRDGQGKKEKRKEEKEIGTKAKCTWGRHQGSPEGQKSAERQKDH